MPEDLLTLSQELVEITRLVEGDDLEGALRRYVERVARTVPGCDHAMITVTGEDGIETVASVTGPDIPEDWGEPKSLPSPIDDVLQYREPRRLDDTRVDDRWPEFIAAATRAGYLSALSLPLAAATEPAAALTLLSREPRQFVDTSYDLVMVFVLHAGVMFDNVSLYNDSQSMVRHLRGALVTRSTIGQAQGLLMRHRSLNAKAAFDELRIASQRRNTKLRELAGALVEAHNQKSLPDALREFGLS
ncbi:GAF and ANTAR domain-containing protein [Pseudonocardia eucalypti]|uniref:GAF and ANTAR domain-containing protein n=1 Tax=Pseudonocardia eucalypti TaxID=648755 RepID=A0ABP9PUC7_9PSEU|nr:GAF domain-containing protein [Pseudonocardia eucalypti]